MKELWSDDNLTIKKEIQFLIEEKIALICARAGFKNLKRLAINKMVSTKTGELLIVNHPHAPSCSSNSCSFYYQKKNNSLRMFECEKVKLVNGLLGFKTPTQIFSLHNRKFQRVTTPNHSSVSFSLQNRQRIYNGEIDNISIDGAKFLVNIPSIIEKDDVVENLTLTLFCRLKSIDETYFHIPQAKVVWLKCDEGGTKILGVQFVLLGKDHDILSDYIDLRTMEDSTRKSDPPGTSGHK